MSDGGEHKHRWTPESTSLLVSVWSDRQVQKQLEYASKPQLIWESVARYMNKKGYVVTGKQCRSRMKQVLVCYREAKSANTRAGVEQYYDSIDRVLRIKRIGQLNSNNNNNNGVDTVDSTVKSPPKEVKTNKNLQMRSKYQQPPDSMYRTEALSPVWSGGSENYPDSPESNETVLAQPFRVFSPVRDAATNTTQQQLTNTNKKILHQNGVIEEAPIKETYRQSVYSNNCFSDIPFQNTVQNVQNQIIQENMQQNQAMLQQNIMQNQILEQNRLQMSANIMRQNVQNRNQGLYADQGVLCNQNQVGFGQQNVITDHVPRIQSNYQMNSAFNRAMPQEPRKNSFRQNLVVTHRQFQEPGLHNYNPNANVAFLSPSISPDIPPNLNEGFCQTKNDRVLNETFTQTASNQINTADMTAITNNATFNDDTLSIDFLQEASPSPENEPVKLKDFAVNTDEIPNAPIRKKKAEKLERLMISAINSQTEVVNKILAAQNDMVNRVLDLDRDRQNRLETRIDHLLDVVQNAVLNKSGGSERSSEAPSPPEPLITNLHPPPKPGVIPPKLDLVPPKPCRVPCTTSVGGSSTAPVTTTAHITAPTRPGVISPVTSPSRRVGAIWQKLGPVSTSPFVRAQQQLGFKPVSVPNQDERMQSSAERRIAKNFETGMDTKALIVETNNFLVSERQLQEEVENARIRESLDRDLQARRRLFSQREPSAAMILTAAFLEAEIQSAEICENARLSWLRQLERNDNYKFRDYVKRNNDNDIPIAGQGNSFEHLKRMNEVHDQAFLGDSRDSSTPAKPTVSARNRDYVEETNEPRQSIQQLAQLVMNSARWRNSNNNQEARRTDLNLRPANGNTQKSRFSNENRVPLRNVNNEAAVDNRMQCTNQQTVDGKTKTLEWLQERYSYGGESSGHNNVAQEIANRRSYNEPPKPPRLPPMGFTTEYLNAHEENNNNTNQKQMPTDMTRRVGFVLEKNAKNDPLEELQQLYIQKHLKIQHSQGLPFMLHNGKVILPQGDMLERYAQEAKTSKNKDTDSENDEEFLDTTASMPSSRKTSLTSIVTKSGKSESNCIIS